MHSRPSQAGRGILRQYMLVLILAVWAVLGAAPALAQSAASDFNHDTTLFPLRGAHETVRCETCHINGVFKGTTTSCSLCHVRGNRSSAVPMPDNHIPLQAGQDCGLCHTTSSFAGVKFDHVTVTPGSCSMCHNGYYATGKNQGHPVTTLSCDACHTIGTFANTALPANHLNVGAAASQCGACHTTTTTAGGVDYTQAALGPTHALTSSESCVTCHSDAAIATSRSAINPALTPKLPSAVNHIPMGSLDCATSGCHQSYATSPSFVIGAASITAPTLNVTGHTAVAAAGQSACTTCHEAGTSFAGMLTSTSVTSDVRPAFDTAHPTTGDCKTCHTTTPTFFSNITTFPNGHVPTGSFSNNCQACHTATGNYTTFDTVAVHTVKGLTCSACHNATTAGAAINQRVPIKLTIANHIPYGSADCASSGCHQNYTASVTSFVIGVGAVGSVTAPTLNPAGHTTLAAAGQTNCSTCHAVGVTFAGLQTNPNATSDVWPGAYDTLHPATTAGDCGVCHTSTPTFASNVNAVPPTHMPTGSYGANCASCHTSPGNYTVYDLVKTHKATGVTCVSCHNSTTAALADSQLLAIKLTTNAPRTHIPVGTLNCASSGCHSNYVATGNTFVIGGGDAGSLTAPTLNVAGHTSVAAATASCTTCHAANTNYSGMLVSTSAVSDVWPGGFDSFHPATTAGDCSACHSTTPTFSSNINAVPTNHLPTGGYGTNCASCHTTAGNYTVYDLVKTHQVTGLKCTSCHNSATAALADSQAQAIKLTTNATRTHIPVGTVDCASSGCHTNYTASGNTFVLGAGDAGNLNTPTLNVAGHTSVAAATASCSTCHAAGSNYSGMQVSTTVLSDVWPGGTGNYDPLHPATTAGDCNTCHTTTPTFGSHVSETLPSTHIPTGSFGNTCSTCHTTAGNYAVFDLVKTHQATGVTCVSCHNSTTAALADAQVQVIKLTTNAPRTHIPVGTLNCASSGCHTNYTASGNTFVIGAGDAGSLTAPTLNVAGHTTVAAATASCTTCHAANTNYSGMQVSTSVLSDVWPGGSGNFDPLHPATTAGDCSTCHSTTPTFSTNVSALPSTHIPTGSFGSACASCHTTPGNDAIFDLVKTHQATGVTCLSCHNSVTAALGDAQVQPIKLTTSAPRTHIPVGTGATAVNCAASGCHTNYTASGNTFVIGGGDAGSLTSPTLTVAGHTSVAAATASCTTCHAANTNYSGMLVSTSAVSDVWPGGFDSFHPATTAGDCSACHTTTPTFSSNINAVPGTHLPTGGYGTNCASCHTTAGNYTVYDLVKTHQVTGLKCTSCHNSATAALADSQAQAIKLTTSATRTHIPVGTVDCASSGCHTNYTASGNTFVIGAGNAGNLNTPTLNVAGHTTVAAATASCSTCHAAGSNYSGMQVSTTVLSDVWPGGTGNYDPLHPATTAGDCSTCHNTAPTFGSNVNEALPAAHIPTGSIGNACATCHTTPGNYTLFDLVKTHTATGVTCLSCHNSTTAALADAQVQPIKLTTSAPRTHIPVGTGATAVNCAASGCHTNYTASGNTFVIGGGDAGSLTSPTLTVAGHTSVAAATASCTTCHAANTNYSGMLVSTTAVSDVWPGGFDSFHPATTAGDCSACHTTTPTFSSNINAVPGTHLPTGGYGTNCASCHTTAGNYTVYDLVKTHQVTGLKCTSCHNSATAALADSQAQAIKLTTSATRTHIPVGTVDCASSGCHTNYTASGNTFVLGAGNAGNLTSPTLNVTGHTTVAAATASCTTCHGAGTNFAGMIASSTTTSDIFPTFDTFHPAQSAGDCSACHTTTPTFASNVDAIPSTHIPTGSFGVNCSSCHTTAGNYAVFDLVVTHTATGVGCVSCHNATTAALTDAQARPIKLQTAVNHIPIGSVECNSSGCHGNYTASTSTFVVGAGTAGSVTAPTLNVAGHTTAATAGITSCSTCHGAGTTYAGMVTSTATLTTDVVPAASVDAYHANYVGDCQTCHTTTPTFASNVDALPTGHMPTGTAGVNCITCHTTAGAYNTANLVATHATGLSCVSCHATSAGPYINAGTAIKTSAGAANHIPFGTMDCGACHAAYPSTGTASFVIGVGAAGNINTPTLNVAQHASAASAGLTTCGTCHNKNGTAVYTGMVASQVGGGDQFPSATEDNQHQSYTGDCVNCHSTTPTFRSNGSGTSKPTAHIPTGSAAACTTCHTAGNFTAAPSITLTHSSTGLACNQCHNANQASLLRAASPAIGTVVLYESSPGITHIPFGTLDCVTCHGNYNGTAAVNSGTWVFTSGGTAGNINTPSLTVALHTAVAAQVSTCSSCHTSSVSAGTVYTGMVASTNTVVGDQFPNATLDAAHQSYTGDCGSCHTTAPTFHGNGSAQPAGHIPTTGSSGCAACHTTGVNTVHSPAAVHTATSLACTGCHNASTAAAAAAATFASSEPVIHTIATASNHIPVGALNCNSSGCHASTPTATTNAGFAYTGTGSFAIGSGAAGNINTPTLTALGHTTILNQSPTPTCMTCHTGTSAGAGTLYTGMVASTSGVAGDTFPPSGLDANHQSFSGTDCGTCHTTTPTFSSNHSGTAGLPSNHIPLSTFPSTPACSACHLNAATYNVAHMNHTGLTGGCKTCHGVAGTALQFANVAPMPEPSNHIPTSTGTLGNACENCHRNALTGNFQTFSGTVMDHTGITGSCVTCHAPGSTFYGVTMVTAPNSSTDGHAYVATLECSSCHSNTQTPPPGSSTTGSAGGFAIAKMVHSVATATPCYYCHEISGNPQYRTWTGMTIKFRRDSKSHYYPGGTNGGPDCVTGCHQHSSSDKSQGTGTTAEPGAILSPATAPTLSSPAIGTAVTRVVTLTNPGGAALSITSVAITGTGFTVTNGCSTSLASLASCSLTIQYKPTAAGSVAGTLTVTDNAAGTTGSTQTLAVTGVVATTTLTGANTPAGQSLSVVMLTSTGANVASLVQTVAFKNTSAAAITFTSEAISGTNAADFAFSSTGVTTPCATNGSVAAGATCNIGMIFTPKTAITYEETALLTVTTTGLPNTYTAQLVGTISSTNGNYAYQARQPARNGRGPTSLIPGKLGPAPATGTPTPSTGTRVQGALGLPTPAVTGAPTVAPAGTSTAGAPATGPASAGTPAGTPAGAPAKGNPATAAAPAASTGTPAPAPLAGNVAAALGLQNGKLPASAGKQAAAGAGFNHAGVVPGQCVTCHNGRAAPGLPARHMLTTRSCDQCHTTIAWIPVNYQHVSPRYARHAGNIACNACHSTNTEVVVPRFPQYGLDCAACHASKFVPQMHRHAENPQLLYSVMDLKDCSGACHVSLGMRANKSPAMSGVHRSTAPQF